MGPEKSLLVEDLCEARDLSQLLGKSSQKWLGFLSLSHSYVKLIAVPLSTMIIHDQPSSAIITVTIILINHQIAVDQP